jgi:hypothetical protein
MRIALTLLLAASCLLAQSDRWEDIHVYVGNDRSDGIVNFVPDTKVLVMIINDKNRVAQAIPYASISKMTYMPKDDHNVLIDYRNAAGVMVTAKLHPHGGNRDKFIAMLGSAVGIPVTIQK